MAKSATKDITPQATVPESDTERLYWAGMLPAVGQVKVKVYTSQFNEETGDYYDFREATSEALFFPRNPNQSKHWAGKCAFYQGLSAGGFVFNAFTEKLAAGVSDGEVSRLVWPGAVALLNAERYRAIVQACKTNVIRMKDGIGKHINTEQGHAMADPESRDPNDWPRGTPERINPRTDTPIAEYVYLVPLDADLSTPPDQYNRLVPSMEQFFRTPPTSLAEQMSKTAAEAGAA